MTDEKQDPMLTPIPPEHARDDGQDPRTFIEVEHRLAGHANVRLSGRCGPDVTRHDIEKRFYHPYFGGRDAGVSEGRFWVTVHTD